ncbi:UNVERIFIED_CONTAM: hypothetical protein GTU68_058803 [Idotea baltica]|nr:hypothetical protein [Idotea baltica]
MWSIGWRIYF